MNSVQAAVRSQAQGSQVTRKSHIRTYRLFQSLHIPAVGQVEGDAALDISSKLQVPQAPQADVEYSDDSHPQI